MLITKGIPEERKLELEEKMLVINGMRENGGVSELRRNDPTKKMPNE